MNRSAGYSLISVVIVTAIGGIIAIMVMALIDNMTQVMVRGTATEAVDGVMSLISTTIGNPDTCGRALRGATATDKLAYTVQDNPVGPPPGGNEIDIPNIFVMRNDVDPPPTDPIASMVPGSTYSMFGGGVTVSSIRFREKRRGVGRTTMRKQGVDYNVYAGEIEVTVTAPAGALPGGSTRRTIPYNPIVDTTTNLIEGCYVRDRSMQELCEAMSGEFRAEENTCEAMINSTNVSCSQVCGGVPDSGGTCVQPCPPPPLPNPPGHGPHFKLFHVVGFDYIPPSPTQPGATAIPRCACSIIKYQPRVRPPAPTPRPPAPPPRPPSPPTGN